MSHSSEAPGSGAQPPATAEKAQPTLPPLMLAAAGLTALNALVTFASFALFFWDAQAATPIIQRAAPFLVLAGVAGVCIGGFVLIKNKRSGRAMEGSKWASPAIVTGLLLMVAAVFLPLIFALSMLVDGGSRG